MSVTSHQITRQDIVGLHEYRQRRDEYVAKMIEYKKARRVKMGDHVSLLFENRDTVLFQIQELVNSEDLTDQAELEEYIEIYSGMLPEENGLSGTLFIEMDNQQLLEEFLVKLMGIEHHLTMIVGGESIAAVFEEEHDDRELTTSVHYLKFPLTQTAKAYLSDGNPEQVDIRLVLSHPALSAEVRLTPKTVNSLKQDLR